MNPLELLMQLLPLGAGVASYFQDRSSGQDIMDLSQNSALDPFGQPNREIFQGLLRDLYADPSSLESLPGYAFAQQQGEKAINRANAARGKFYSTNVLHDLAQFNQGLAEQQYRTERDALAQLSGAGISPDARGMIDAYMKGRDLKDNALGQLLYGLRTSAEGEGLSGDIGRLLTGLLSGTGGIQSAFDTAGSALADVFGFGGNADLAVPQGDGGFNLGGDFPSTPPGLSNFFGGGGGAPGPAAAAGFDLFGGAGSLAELAAPLAGLPASLFGGGLGTSLSTSSIPAASGFNLFPAGALNTAGLPSGALGGVGGAAPGMGGLFGPSGLGTLGLTAAFAAPLLYGISQFGEESSQKVWNPFMDQIRNTGPVTIPAGQPGAGEQGIPFQFQGETVYLDPSAMNDITDPLGSNPMFVPGSHVGIVGTNEAIRTGNVSEGLSRGPISQTAEATRQQRFRLDPTATGAQVGLQKAWDPLLEPVTALPGLFAREHEAR